MKLFDSVFGSVSFYVAGVCEAREMNHINALQDRAVPLFLDAHKFTTLVSQGDMGWAPSL